MWETRTVNIELIEQRPQSRKLIFLPKLKSASSKVLLQNYYETITENGIGSTDLPCNSTGPTKYTVIIPTDEGPLLFDFFLSPGGPVDLASLIAAGGSATTSLMDYISESQARAAHPFFAGNYPNVSFPAANVKNAVSGNNDLYTVPSGRKAVVLDYLATNNTGGTIQHYPQIKISGNYYRIGATQSDNPATLGHNYGMSGSRSAPILLNAGESFAVNASAVDLAIWAMIIEFDDSSLLARADLRTWSAGNNILFTVPAGKTVAMGFPGLTSANQPAQNITGVLYFNNTGSSRTISAIYFVKSGDSPGVQNQVAAPGSIGDKTVFSKNFPCNLEAGSTVVIALDSAAAGSFAWVNYIAL